MYWRWFCYSRMDLLFLSAIRKKKITKRKTAGCRSEAKKSSIFLNEKNSLTLKQLFVLHGKYSIFLHASPRRPGEASLRGWHIASLVDVDVFVVYLYPSFTHIVIQRSIATKDLVYIHLCESYVSPSWCSWDTSVSLDWICNPFIFLGSQTLIIEHGGLQIRCDKKNSLTNADVRQGVLCRWYLMSKFFTIFQSLRWIVL